MTCQICRTPSVASGCQVGSSNRDRRWSSWGERLDWRGSPSARLWRTSRSGGSEQHFWIGALEHMIHLYNPEVCDWAEFWGLPPQRLPWQDSKPLQVDHYPILTNCVSKFHHLVIFLVYKNLLFSSSGKSLHVLFFDWTGSRWKEAERFLSKYK